MNQETIKWIRETTESIHISIIGRYESGTLKNEDLFIMNEVLENILVGMEGSDPKNELLEGVKESLFKLNEIFCVKPDDNSIRQVKTEVQDLEHKLDELDKVNYIANALQLDVKGIMPLLEQLRQKQEEIRQSFQHAVDIDFKIHGQVSDLTKNALEAYHFEVAPDKQVIAAVQIQTGEVKKDPPKEKAEEKKEPDVSVSPKTEEKREYLHMPPMGKEQFSQAVSFLKENGGRFDGERKAWYIEPGSISRKELDSHHLEAAFADREYLRIPSQGKEQFKKTTAFLKENGARFDQTKKSWYLLPESSGKAIKDYLSQKDSVLSKLKQNENEIEKGRKTAQRQEREGGMER